MSVDYTQIFYIGIENELKNKLPEEYHNDIMLYFRKSIG